MRYLSLTLTREDIDDLLTLNAHVSTLKVNRPNMYAVVEWYHLHDFCSTWRTYDDDEGEHTKTLDALEGDVDSEEWVVLPPDYCLPDCNDDGTAKTVQAVHDGFVFAGYAEDGKRPTEVESQRLTVAYLLELRATL